jgi:hypothetical protein
MDRALTTVLVFYYFFTGMVGPSRAEPFDFIALGDTAYNVPEDYPVYEALIKTINAAHPAFSIHVGDIIGVERCTDAMYKKHLAYFQNFDRPLIYTPGDNEWVDCHFSEPLFQDKQTGRFDIAALIGGATGSYGQDRLQVLRKVFFAKPESLGKTKLALHRQSDGESEYPEMLENARWSYGGALFATFHVPGSLNGLSITSENASLEAIRRNRANMAWLETTFENAEKEKSRAIILVFHADVFETVHAVPSPFTAVSSHNLRGGSTGPFYWFTRRLAELADNFKGQILLVNGDGHQFIIDRPMTISRGEDKPPIRPNVTRLQVYGAPEIKAVRVTVDTETAGVFSFSPLYN